MITMTSDAPRRPRLQHVSSTGAALATVLIPLAAGALLARAYGADPLTPVNAFITNGGQRAGAWTRTLPGCGRHALRSRMPSRLRAKPRLTAVGTMSAAMRRGSLHRAAG